MAKRKGQARAAGGELVYGGHTRTGFVWMTEEEAEEELIRRVEEVMSGKVKTIPADEAIRQVQEELRRRRGGR